MRRPWPALGRSATAKNCYKHKPKHLAFRTSQVPLKNDKTVIFLIKKNSLRDFWGPRSVLDENSRIFRVFSQDSVTYRKTWMSEITFNWINQQDAAPSQVYYLSFKYSSTYFGHHHAHHQELKQLQQQPLAYRRSLLIAVLLVVVRPAGPTTTNSTAITTLRR